MRKLFKITLVIGGVAFAVMLFLLSPFFYISDKVVTGCETIATDEVLERAGITGTTNLLIFNITKARQKIMENPYIDGVEFQKILPGTLNITIRERHLSGYVEYMQGKYLYIDENGRLLEINSYFTKKLPVVSGLKFTRIRLGELLEVEDTAAFKTVVVYARSLNRPGNNQLTDLISRIDVSDSENTRIFVYHIEFNVGDGKNADEKIRTIKEITNNLPNAEIMKGFVDLKEIKNQYYFKILV